MKEAEKFMRALAVMMSVSGVVLLCSCRSVREYRGPAASGAAVWDVDNLDCIGGHRTEVLGSPAVVETVAGKAVEFDGVADGLVVDALPLAGVERFTLEIVFRPDADGPAEQRFLHLQENGTANRILIETRLVEGGKWYLDTYIHTPKGNQALFDAANTHATGKWYSAALVYDGERMRHYVDGVEEMSARLAFNPLCGGRTSIGVRMNRVYWFKGAISKVRFTPCVLERKQFLAP